MSRRVRGLLVICAFGVVLPLSAAETSQPRGIAPPKRIPDVIEPTQSPDGDPVTTAAIPREVRRAVVADAAKRFGVAENAVVIARAVQITWSDGSLGCPQPGRVYTQTLVPGYRIVARREASDLTYHTDSRGNVVMCAVAVGAPSNRLSDKAVKGVEPVTRPAPPTEPDR